MTNTENPPDSSTQTQHARQLATGNGKPDAVRHRVSS